VARREVVIAILSWNRLPLLKECLQAIRRNTDYPHTICVVDQGSTDGTKRYLERLGHGIVTISLDQNVGFVRGNNRVMARFPCHDVVLLNNDTIVQPGWLTALADRAYSATEVGIVGAKLIYPDGRLQEAGGEVFRDGSGRNVGKLDDPERWIYNQVREVDYCSGACLYIKRDVLDRVGCLDERYDPAYYEDTDLCFTAAAAGFKVLYEPAAVVVHLEGATAGKGSEQSSRSKQLQERNRPLFVSKWQHLLQGKRGTAYELPLRPGREKLLFIGPLVPAHDTASGELRIYLTIKELTKDFDIVYVGRNVTARRYIRDLEMLGVTVFAPDTERLRVLGTEVDTPPLDVLSLLQSNVFLAVIVSFHHVAHQYYPFIKQVAARTCFILDTVDIHYLREWRRAEVTGDDHLFWNAEEEKRRELTMCRVADLVLTVTEQDRQALIADAPELEVRVAPNIHDIVPDAPDAGTEERQGLLFVGGFNHPPNVDAMLWFCGEVFPKIVAAIPNLNLHIVGSNPPAEIRRLAGTHVRVEGHVPSTLPYLRQCRISVAPLRYGAGMKGKVGEALAAGIPIVTTAVGAEGMGLEDGRHVLIAEDAEGFAEAIVRLYRDGALRSRLAEAGRQLVASRFSNQSVGALWRAILGRARDIVGARGAAVASGREGTVKPIPNALGRNTGYRWLQARPRLVPNLTVVIPVHNGLALTQQCVETIRRYTEIPCGILIVNNGSTDDTFDWCWRDHLECIGFSENRGFAAACNAGIRAALGEYVVILNNDTLVSPGWAERLLAHLDRNRTIGLVGPSTNYASSLQQIESSYNGLEEYLAFAKRIARQYAGKAEAVDRLVGVCLAARRELFEEVGLFDERFGMGNYEDDDFCMRVRQRGYMLLWAKDVFIHHIGSQTFAAVQTDYQGLLTRNREILRQKWDLRTHTPERIRHIIMSGGPLTRGECPPVAQVEPGEERLQAVVGAVNAEQWQQALTELTHLGAAFPASATVQGLWGRALFGAGRAEEAEARLRRAVALAPRDRGWRFLLVQLYLERRRFQEALAEVEAWQQVSPEDADAAQLAGRLRQLRSETRVGTEVLSGKA
jgi:GT2 family glycosyltransferase/glycosyltransferase involved in cell wall biosynthesis